MFDVGDFGGGSDRVEGVGGESSGWESAQIRAQRRQVPERRRGGLASSGREGQNTTSSVGCEGRSIEVQRCQGARSSFKALRKEGAASVEEDNTNQERKEERTITKVPMTRVSGHVDILDSSRCSYFRSSTGSKVEYGLGISAVHRL